MNIAVFGGSFDPPHIGHEEIIKEALKKLDIEILFVVPTFLNPFKKTSFASATKRYEWIKKLLKNHPKTKVIKYEMEKTCQVSTIETIKHLIKTYKTDKIYLIIGADNLSSLSKWKDYKELEKLVQFVIASRNDIKIPKHLKKLNIHANISSTKLREEIKKKYLPKSIANEVMEYYTRKKMDKRIEKIINVLDEKKAENIQLFDMRSKDYFVNDVVIATTLGQKHGIALLDYLKIELKSNGENHFNTEPSDEWTVIDLGDILIHLMTSQYRAKYNIEEFLSNREEKFGNQT